MILNNDHISEVFPSVFRIRINLPNNPLRFVNSYLVKGKERSLLIDTAFNLESCYDELSFALNYLNVDRKNLDLFITHIHADHIGLLDRFIKNSRVFMSNVEQEVVVEAIKHPDYWHLMNVFLLSNGMPKEILEGALKYLDLVYVQTYPSMKSDILENFKSIRDGEILSYGDLDLQGLLTPGHSPGHMCLYDEKNKILFSGDHVLFDITPNITWWPNLNNALKSYFDSLEKINKLKIELTFPGHGEPGKDIHKRIEDIIRHHNKRLDEILSSLYDYKNAYEIAREIKWNLKYDKWEAFPKTQKYFALGETIAHLIYLKENNLVEEKVENEIILYKRAL
ncbi:MAG: MBL fold metallo-hydrolase [Thermoplasmata archaeon]